MNRALQLRLELRTFAVAFFERSQVESASSNVLFDFPACVCVHSASSNVHRWSRPSSSNVDFGCIRPLRTRFTASLEYAFSPSTVAIDLESGDSKEVLFHAERVAYSVLGTVTLISGQPKESVYVEARSESNDFFEEATTDVTGSFRLRGLLPGKTYTIKLATKEEPRLGSSRIERFSPDHLSVKVGTEDIIGVDFIVFEQPEMTILSGHVEGYNLEILQPHLSIEIRSASDPSEIESVIPLPISNYFQIRDLAKGRHLVQLRPGLGWKRGRFESEILEVDLVKQPQVHVGPLKYNVVEHQHKQELTPAPVFSLIAGVFVIIIFISLPRLKDLYLTATEKTQLGLSSVTRKKEIRKPVLRKRAN